MNCRGLAAVASLSSITLGDIAVHPSHGKTGLSGCLIAVFHVDPGQHHAAPDSLGGARPASTRRWPADSIAHRSNTSIREVASAVDNDFSTLLAWMGGSGFAHGAPWASLAMLEVAQQIDLGGGVLLRRSTGTLQGVV